MAEIIRMSGSTALPGGVQDIDALRGDKVHLLVEATAKKNIQTPTEHSGASEERVLRLDYAIRLDDEQVAQFRNQMAEAKALAGEVDPRQGTIDENGDEESLPVGDDSE